MKKLLILLLGSLLGLFTFSSALAQHQLQFDDGAGHTLIMKIGPGTLTLPITEFTFPSGGGTLIVAPTPGTSALAWLTAGNTLSSGQIFGSLNAFDVVMQANGAEKMRLISGGGISIVNAALSIGGVSYTFPASNAAGVLTNNGSGVLSWVPSSSDWSLTGNAGTTAGTNFIGTTDNKDLHIYVNGGVDNRLILGTNGAIYHERTSVWGLGNIRGVGATDMQVGRSSATQIASGSLSVIGGGFGNTASGNETVVAGGGQNIAIGDRAAVLGGLQNMATGNYSSVGGGTLDSAIGNWSTVAGGGVNKAGDVYTTVGGGFRNKALGQNSTIAGGFSNTASGNSSTVAGGDNNTAGGTKSIVAGGSGMTLNASANFSFGFLGGGAVVADQMIISTPNTATFGNTNLWLANNNNTPSELRFYEAQNTTGAFPAASTNYTAFKAGVQTADVTYTLPTGDGTIGQVLSTNGTGVLSWISTGSGSDWSITGNTGTTAGTNFIGTTDNQALDLRANNVIGLRLNTNGSLQRDAAGNGRGLNAVDLQNNRIAATQVASGPNAIVGGSNNTASGDASIAMGKGSAATDLGAVAMGISVQATEKYAVAMGVGSLAGGPSSFAVGNGAHTDGQSSMALGENVNVVGSFSVAMGTTNTVSGSGSTIAGGSGLTLNAAADNSFGFRAGGTAAASNMIIGTANTATFGNANLWLANNNNTPSELRFYEAQNTTGPFPAASTNYTAFKAGVQAADVVYTLPTAAPTLSGQVLSSTTGGVMSWVTASGGLVNFTEAVNNTAPNATIPVVSLTANNAALIVDVALRVKGAGSLLATVPDNAIAGGNKRGTGAVDWQGGRDAATQVASGNGTVIAGGFGNTASGGSSVVGGGTHNSVSTANSVIAGGEDNIIDVGANATIGGGFTNHAGELFATVSGGSSNNATGQRSTIIGGAANTASANGSTVLGGSSNSVAGSYSVVSGRGLTLDNSSFGSFGFLSNNGGANPMTISSNNTVVFGNADVWLVNNFNSPVALRFYEAYNATGAFPNTVNYVAFQAPNTLSTNTIYTLPTADGANGQVLSTNGAGTLSWKTSPITGRLTPPAGPTAFIANTTVTATGAIVITIEDPAGLITSAIITTRIPGIGFNVQATGGFFTGTESVNYIIYP